MNITFIDMYIHNDGTVTYVGEESEYVGEESEDGQLLLDPAIAITYIRQGVKTNIITDVANKEDMAVLS